MLFGSPTKKASPHENIFTVGIGGAAGDGAHEAGASLAELLNDFSFEAFVSFDYPSLIRGGHNFSRVSFSGEKIHSDHSALDVLVALNEETLTIHRNELHKDAVVLADSFEKEDLERFGANAVVLPMKEFAQKIGAPPITRTSAALGAACYLLGFSLDNMKAVLNDVFKNKSLDANLKLAEMGYEHLEKLQFRHWKKLTPQRKEEAELTDGNTAFAKGLVAAGLDFYFAYPMTPSSSILHFLAKQQKEYKIKVVQPESELAVINMALGAAYAGKRAAVGTATGGFALMQEAFALSGMAELPLAIAVSQRYAPATGTPTYTSQGDLQFVLHSGHGEFPRIVLAPGDPKEAFACGAEALNFAWKYQTPVIVLLDRQLSESLETSAANPAKIAVERGKIAEGVPENYGRYKITPDGISPMIFPGTPGAVVKVDSYEHDENGIAIDEAEKVKAMGDKRFAKAGSIAKEMGAHNTIKVYGDKSSRDVIVFWGSTKGAVLEAAKYLAKPVKLLQIVWMEPFDAERVAAELGGAKTIIDVEMNRTAQLAALIREKTGVRIDKKILQYNARPFDPLELAEKINNYLK
jgi:2-oxoglutarate ferredoxin oxidoreductase subunit alpha